MTRSTAAAVTPSLKILLVEDCASDVFLLRHMLGDAEGEGLEIRHVPRLIDAFQAIDEQPFDVILLDLNLTDIDGIASVAALNAQAPHTPILIYSGMEDRKLKEAALLCGARAYLIKGKENGLSLQRAIRDARLPPDSCAPHAWRVV